MFFSVKVLLCLVSKTSFASFGEKYKLYCGGRLHAALLIRILQPLLPTMQFNYHQLNTEKNMFQCSFSVHSKGRLEGRLLPQRRGINATSAVMSVGVILYLSDITTYNTEMGDAVSSSLL